MFIIGQSKYTTFQDQGHRIKVIGHNNKYYQSAHGRRIWTTIIASMYRLLVLSRTKWKGRCHIPKVKVHMAKFVQLWTIFFYGLYTMTYL